MKLAYEIAPAMTKTPLKSKPSLRVINEKLQNVKSNQFGNNFNTLNPSVNLD